MTYDWTHYPDCSRSHFGTRQGDSQNNWTTRQQVLLDHLQTLSPPLPALPPDEQAELDALKHLSDDTLWTIAREQMPDNVQARAHELMDKNSHGEISSEEYTELEKLVERSDRLMVRKAEAAALLRERLR